MRSSASTLEPLHKITSLNGDGASWDDKYSYEKRPRKKDARSFCSANNMMFLSTAVIMCIQPVVANYTSETNYQVLSPSLAGQATIEERPNSKLIRDIWALAQYEDGWHGSGSKAASHNALIEAEQFVRLQDFSNLYLPYVSLTADGEVNFWWDLPSMSFDLGFFGDGTLAYYAKMSDDEREFIEDSGNITQLLPSEILNKLMKA